MYSIFSPLRVTAATKMNDVSSRSHAIFTINFTQVITSLLCGERLFDCALGHI